ncbi:uncharacterized protein KD926_009128 [Aspergillus affinis]|uniref:uncharacterized protein n=1 Tax=Aspergillus affinis TaxID=1070780 RepID=UPI0022FECBA7|nr:uncharacterized protein KD926_009128 [Aspergillus affinis]KAI9039785.1 hypothetical protein KD926_009128 [Aspergillus affinis]
MRIVHEINSLTPSMEGWKSQVTRINSRCGFCGQTFVAWAERNDHLAQHFRAGAVMKDWGGCRGLDPPVALAVKNAMPPYLIGMESARMEPFSASRVADGPPGETEAKPTSFEHLTSRLTSFVNEMCAKHTAVTDAMFQKEARYIITRAATSIANERPSVVAIQRFIPIAFHPRVIGELGEVIPQTIREYQHNGLFFRVEFWV